MFSQNQKVFALGMIAFAMPASASQDEGCTALYSGDIRQIEDTSYAWGKTYVDGFFISTVLTGIQTNLHKKYCSNDNSIRNSDNMCLTWMQQEGDDTLGTSSCHANYQACTGEATQQFTVSASEVCNDNMGHPQNCVAFYNVAKETCLGRSGGICGDCTNPEVKNMFRSTGAAVFDGIIENVASQRCLVPVANIHDAQVSTIECDDKDLNQKFTLYENGEIRHDMTGLCLGDNENRKGIFSVSFCADKTTQGFTPVATIDGYHALQWMADDSQCVEELSVQDGSAAPRTCNSSDEQKWKFGSQEWSSPSFEWVQMGCGNGIDTSYAYSEQITMTDANNNESVAADSLIDEAKSALKQNTYIPNPTNPDVSAEDVPLLSETYAEMMYHPSDATIDRSHLFSCSGESHCMYRSVMTMKNSSIGQTLNWATGYTVCMQADPVCVPLTQQKDGKCVADSEYQYSMQ